MTATIAPTIYMFGLLASQLDDMINLLRNHSETTPIIDDGFIMTDFEVIHNLFEEVPLGLMGGAAEMVTHIMGMHEENPAQIDYDTDIIFKL